LHNYWQKRKTKKFKKEIEKIEEDIKRLQTKKQEKLASSPTLYAEQILGLKLFPYQIKLLEDKSKRIVACMGRQSGKTTTIAIKAIYFADTNPNTTVLITSPSLRQSMIMFDRITTFINSTHYLHNKIIRTTRTQIQFENKSRIIALPCSENLLRGYTAHMVICDEAAFMPEETITQIIFPMLSTTNGYAIFLSTPWGKNHFFYRAFVNPAYSVHKVKSSECPLIKPEFLTEMKQNMTKEAYLMEYEAEFVEEANSYFSQDLIRSCIQTDMELLHENEILKEEYNWKQFIGEYYAGIDLGKLQDHSALAVVKKESIDLIKLIFLKEFPINTPYSHVIGFITKANNKFHFQKILIDKTGIGEPILEEMRNQGLTNIEGINLTAQTKAEILGYLRVKMEQKQFKMPYNHRLCQQINEQKYEFSKTGQLQFWHPPNTHDDQLWALALAIEATKHEKETTKPYFTPI
jgi:phage terminase large subunit-like protein